MCHNAVIRFSNTVLTLAALTAGCLAFALQQTTLIPALPEIQRQLHASTSDGSWLVTAYFLSASIATPILGRLGDMFGKRRMLAVALGATGIGSALGAASSSLELLIVARLIQGLGGGVFPLSFAIVRDELPRRLVPTGIGLLSAVGSIGAGVGFPLGGVIVDHASYHWIFWLAAAVAGIAIVAVLLFVPESRIRPRGRVDVRGGLVLAVGLALPLLAVSQANEWGWASPVVIAMIAVGTAILVGLVRLERQTVEPLIDVDTLSQRSVLTTNVATFFIGFGLFGGFVLLPQLMQLPPSDGVGLGTTATEAGLLLVPMTLLQIVAASAAGSVGARFGSKIPLLVGCGLATLGMTALVIRHASVADLLVGSALLGVGIGAAFAAMPNLIIESVHPTKTGQATGVNMIMRNAGAATGSAVSGTLLAGHLSSGGGLGDVGFALAFGACAAVSLLATIACALITDPRRSRAVATAPPSGASDGRSEPVASERARV